VFFRTRSNEPKTLKAIIEITRGPNISSVTVKSNPFLTLQQASRQLYAETALLPFSAINGFWYYGESEIVKCEPVLYEAQWACVAHVFFNISISKDYPGPLGNFAASSIELLMTFRGLKKVTF
jgi:hypothetical protein